MEMIILLIIVAVLVLWVVGTQRSLVVLDENIKNALSQIGVQLSSRFDALTALLDLTKQYAEHESKTITETIQQRRGVITAQSSASDVASQEGIISDALGKIAMIGEQYPELKANTTYLQTMNSVNEYENTVRTSRMIFNDSVTKLNRKIRMFPVSLIAGMLGFTQKEYLQEDQSKTAMPSMK